jgi:transposase
MTGSFPKTEILTDPQRRRRWSVSEKLEIVAETREPGVTVSLVARRRGVSPNQLFTWRRLAEQGALTATRAEEEVVPASALRANQEQIRELQRLLGKKTLEAEILKEALEIATESKNEHCGRCRCPGTVRDEGHMRDNRRHPLECRGAGGRALSQAQRPPAAAGWGIAGADQGRSSPICRPTATRASGLSCAATASPRTARL